MCRIVRREVTGPVGPAEVIHSAWVDCQGARQLIREGSIETVIRFKRLAAIFASVEFSFGASVTCPLGIALPGWRLRRGPAGVSTASTVVISHVML